MKISVKAKESVVSDAVASQRSVRSYQDDPVVVQIADLELQLGKLQMRSGINEEHIEHDLRPKLRDDVRLKPITVVRLADGRLLVVDGFHRVEASTREGILGIEAIVVDGDEEKAFELALAANDEHGLPLSNEDKAHKLHKAVEHYRPALTSGEMSYQELAKRTRLSLTFVHKLVSAMGISPDGIRWVKRGDSVYPMKVDEIGHKKSPKTRQSGAGGSGSSGSHSEKSSSRSITLSLSADLAAQLCEVAQGLPDEYRELQSALLAQLEE